MSELNILDTEELQVVAFNLGKEEYAIPIINIQEIIMPEATTQIPKSPAFMEGVLNLRGSIIPIIDGRKRFGLEQSENLTESRIMVLELKNSTIGLIVDSVSEVIHLQTKEIQPSPLSAENEENFILGICKYAKRLIILLDPDKFLDLSEIESIQNISQIAQKMTDLQETLVDAKA